MMLIDCQSHVFPRPYLDVLSRNPGYPRVIWEGSAFTVTWEIQRFNLREETYDPEHKIVEMDRVGIDYALLSTNMPGPCSLPPELGVPAARVLNDSLKEIVEAHPTRFGALAGIPWQDVNAAVGEIERAKDRGFLGFVLYSNVGGIPVDDPSLEPAYGAVERTGMPIVLHPTMPAWGGAVKDHSMITMMALQIDTSFALLRLILGGVLERHPDLRVVMPHAGGVLPYMMGRIEHQTETMGRGKENIIRPVRSYLDRVFYDTVSPSEQALKYIYEFAGADHLVFGTDHPWVDPGVFVDLIARLEIPSDLRDLILGGNAKRLFKLGP